VVFHFQVEGDAFLGDELETDGVAGDGHVAALQGGGAVRLDLGSPVLLAAGAQSHGAHEQDGGGGVVIPGLFFQELVEGVDVVGQGADASELLR
jgi:hypothetical protein